MTTTKTVDRNYRRYGRTWRAAERRLNAGLEAATGPVGVADAVRRYADDLEEIPATVRAMEHALAIGTMAVELLEARGVAFANRDNAPAQVAAFVHSAWTGCNRSGQARATDWLHLANAVLAGVEHAAGNPQGVPEHVRAVFKREG